MPTDSTHVSQCQKPRGWLGRFTLWRMNKSHSKLTDWGLSHVAIAPHFTILDVGCGGGRTVSKLAARASQGRVLGIDHSGESVAASQKINAPAIAAGQVEICQASVSRLPFPDNTFDLITAVETHFWWSNPVSDMREVFRVVQPGGALILIAEIYKGANTMAAKLAEKYAERSPITLLSPDEHRDLLSNTGFSGVQIDAQPDKGWICAIGQKK